MFIVTFFLFDRFMCENTYSLLYRSVSLILFACRYFVLDYFTHARQVKYFVRNREPVFAGSGNLSVSYFMYSS